MTLLFFILFACSTTATIPIQGTTARIDETYQSEQNVELDMVIMTSEEQCKEFFATQNQAVRDIGETAYQRNMEACLPWIDRGAGEVKLSMRFELDGETYPLALGSKNIQISHDNQKVELNPPSVAQRVIGHNPSRGEQLFIIVIDASPSMGKPLTGGSDISRMDMVKQALKSRGVKEAFFPDGARNYVAMYTFTSGDPRPLGGSLRILNNKSDYLAMVDQLQAQSGYTHLYNAVEYGMTKIPKESKIKELLDSKIHPTLVVLTDGFNNVEPKDTCSTNVTPLQNLLDTMDGVMAKQSINEKMDIVTIGFGKKLNARFKAEKWKEKEKSRVKTRHLCRKINGQIQRNERIDASGTIDGLEKYYIDNVSLAMIAEQGNGRTFVRKDAAGLGKAFEDVVAIRYQWFEIQYRQSPLKLRKDFDVRFKLLGFLQSMSHVKIYPHAWTDGPPGKIDEEGWSSRGSIWHSTTILSAGVGLFVFLSLLGAAIFNVKRFLMGRLSRD